MQDLRFKLLCVTTLVLMLLPYCKGGEVLKVEGEVLKATAGIIQIGFLMN